MIFCCILPFFEDDNVAGYTSHATIYSVKETVFAVSSHINQFHGSDLFLKPLDNIRKAELF